MKQILTLAFVVFWAIANAQTTKIQDAKVDFSKGRLTIFMTDSLATSISVQLGTTFQSHDVMNNTAIVVGTDLAISDTFVIPLTNVSPGVYYVDVKVTTANGIQQMEFQTAD